jgi:Na+-driven multidrug efflux pump
MIPFSTVWLREARALSGLTLALAITMFAHMEMAAVETLIIARLGVRELAGVTLAIGLFSLLFLFALGVVTAVTPIAAAAYGTGDRADLRRIGQQGILVGLTFALPSVAGLLGCAALAEVVMGPGVEARSLALYPAGGGGPTSVLTYTSDDEAREPSIQTLFQDRVQRKAV